MNKEQHELASQLISDFVEGCSTEEEMIDKLCYYCGMTKEQAQSFALEGAK